MGWKGKWGGGVVMGVVGCGGGEGIWGGWVVGKGIICSKLVGEGKWVTLWGGSPDQQRPAGKKVL